MSVKIAPTLAVRDAPGVLAFSEVASSTPPEDKPVVLYEASQKVKMSAVIPNEDQKAILFLIYSGLDLRFSR